MKHKIVCQFEAEVESSEDIDEVLLQVENEVTISLESRVLGDSTGRINSISVSLLTTV